MIRRLFCFANVLSFSCILSAQVSVLTANYDNERTNANLSEFVLNKSNVDPTQFGKLYTFTVQGQVYAQPLYVRGLSLPDGTTRNVLFVATMHNSVYAFDADATSGTLPIWSRNLGQAVNPHDFDVPDPNSLTTPPTVFPYTDILNEIGILSTPVIDPTTNTLYLIHYSYTSTATPKTYAYYLHAIDLTSGAEKFGGPVQIQASVTGTGWAGEETPVNGQLLFNAGQHLQRPGLLLLNGAIYAGFGSHGDEGPWHGWILGYNATTLQQTSVFNTTPNNAAAGSVWQGGRGLAADPEGNIYCTTANGDWDGDTEWGESVLRLTPTGGLSVADYFTPAEWNPLNMNDTDFGSSGPVLIAGTNEMLAIGKEGELFMLDKTNLGHEATSNGQILQSFQAADPGLTLGQAENSSFVFNNAFWNNAGGSLIYLWPYGEPLVAYRIVNGMFDTTPFTSNNNKVFNSQPFPGMTISAYGSLSSSGILWITSDSQSSLPSLGTLHAFDALDLSTELWNSDMNRGRDMLGSFSKFANPTVANGKVFAPTASGEVVVYGLLPNVPAIAAVVNGASFGFGAVAPGELVTIFGTGVGPATAAGATAVSGQIPTQLGGIQVTFGGTAAPLLYGSSGQVNAVVPFEVAGQSSVQMLITSGTGSLNVTLPVVDANPSIFTANGSGTGQGAILNNATMTPNSPSNPAERGAVVAIYATGTGATNPASVDGALAPSMNPPVLANPVTVTIGGQAAKVLYQGAAPGLVAGVAQINVQVPATVPTSSAVPVIISLGGASSASGVTMAVK